MKECAKKKAKGIINVIVPALSRERDVRKVRKTAFIFAKIYTINEMCKSNFPLAQDQGFVEEVDVETVSVC